MWTLVKNDFSVKESSNNHTLEAAIPRWCTSKVFLKISQNLQENTFGGVSLLIKLQAKKISQNPQENVCCGV